MIKKGVFLASVILISFQLSASDHDRKRGAGVCGFAARLYAAIGKRVNNSTSNGSAFISEVGNREAVLVEEGNAGDKSFHAEGAEGFAFIEEYFAKQ